jgi:single-strand DNA-binding protein
MASLNRVLLIGNLTRDPQVKYTPKGTAVVDIGLAVNRHYSGDDGQKHEDTCFVDVTLWGRQAEVAQEYLTKGRQVFIEGRLHLDTWDDKQSGQKRSRLRVVAENMQMLGDRPSTQKPSPTNPAASKQPAPTPQRQPPKDPDLDADPDDIPFRTTIYRDIRRSRLSRRVVQ